MARPFWVEPLKDLLERFADEYGGEPSDEAMTFSQDVRHIFLEGFENGLAPRGAREEHVYGVHTSIMYKSGKRFKVYRVVGLQPFIGPGESAPVFVEHTVDRRFPEEP